MQVRRTLLASTYYLVRRTIFTFDLNVLIAGGVRTKCEVDDKEFDKIFGHWLSGSGDQLPCARWEKFERPVNLEQDVNNIQDVWHLLTQAILCVLGMFVLFRLISKCNNATNNFNMVFSFD